ncbi:MAG: BspA family leucine-rich repeat surface protein [Prevotella sp.]|nr:BspA family leucine-rich repeat surface protein [Prevotella sp.]
MFEESFRYAPPKRLTNWFEGFTKLSSISGIENLKTSSAESMNYMFKGCSNLAELDLSSFDTSNVTEMRSMFEGCSKLESINLSNFNTSKVENMYSMFDGCSSLTELDLTSFNTSNVQYMNYMFRNCSSMKNIYRSDGFVINNSTTTTGMYTNCGVRPFISTPCVVYCADNQSLHFMRCAMEELTNGSTITIDGYEVTLADNNRWKEDAVINTTEEPGWSKLCSDVSTVVFEKNFKNIQPNSCGIWFSGFSNLKEIKGIENLNTSNVTNMSYMFSNCSSLTSLDLRSFNTSKVTNMEGMFYGCSSLTSLNLSSFRTENVTTISNMFNGCSSLTSLDIRNFYMLKMERYNGNQFLYKCPKLEILDLSNCTGYLKEFADFVYEDIKGHQMIIKVPDDSETIEGLWRDENYMVTSAGTSFVRQFTEGNMSTVCLPFAVSASNEGGTFYRYDSYDGTDVVFKKVTEEMTEANTAYLFMPSTTGKVTFTGNTALASLPADIIEGEETGLYGVYTKKTFTADDADKGIYYGWAQGQFRRAGANAAVNPNRAYLKLPAAAAARLSVRLDGNGTTGISTAGSSADGSTDAPVYNLQGQRVGSSYKGVVIKNGKKMIVK